MGGKVGVVLVDETPIDCYNLAQIFTSIYKKTITTLPTWGGFCQVNSRKDKEDVI